MKFFMTPGSCSTGIHVLLEELELPFEAHVVDLVAGANRRVEYLAINPKGSVPTLVLDSGKALVDFQSIAWWLGASEPKRGLLPAGAQPQAEVIEWLNYAVNDVHGQGFTRVFTPERYTDDPTARPRVESLGRSLVERALQRFERRLVENEYLVERYGIADAALFYLEFWCDRISLELPAACAAHYERVLQRRAVRQVLAEEGYASTLRKYPLRA